MKRTAIILLLITLVCGSVGGFAYAQTHEPIKGDKLIGYGPYGHTPGDTDEIYYTLFTITNPDCNKEITINQVSIICADGTIIYEGQPFPSATIPPHGVRWIRLADRVNIPPTNTDCKFYTAEISWSSKGKCLPLIGHVVVFQKNLLGDGTFNLSKTRVAMENLDY